MTPDEPSATLIEASGPAGGAAAAGSRPARKWKFAREAPRGDQKYLICNADEGDPGAFMDRMRWPRAIRTGVLEGMIIAAYAIGATKAYIYIRAEYPVRGQAPQRSDRAGVRNSPRSAWAENILNSGVDFSTSS